MSKSNVFEEDFMKFVFQGIDIAGIAAVPTSGALTGYYIALHTADPGEGGSQTTSEVTYGGYARVLVPRSAAGWAVNQNSVSPVNAIDFPAMASGTAGTATHVSIGTAATGAGKILYKGALSPTVPYSEGTIPRLRTTSAVTED